MTVWRIQSNTSKLNIAEYCINNHIAAMGWSLLEYEGETSDLQFDTFEEYCELAENYYGQRKISICIHIIQQFVQIC